MAHNYVEIPLASQLSITGLINIQLCNPPQNFNFPGEQHDFWEFIFIEKGELLITAGEKQYILKSGEMAFHRPNEFHAVASPGVEPSTYIICAFVSKDSCMEYFEHKILSLNGLEKELLYNALHQAEKIFAAFKEQASTPNEYKLEVFNSPPFGAEQMFHNYLEIMLLNLYQRKEGKNAEIRMASYAKRSREEKLCKDIENYLESHITEILKLEDISAQTGYCISQIQKIFKANTNQSIIDYFIDLKIAKTKQLIRNGSYNFTQIAAKLGYENVNYFSRLFKSKTGITLSEYSQS